MFFAKIGLSVYDICVINCCCRLSFLHFIGRIDSDCRNVSRRIFVVDHKRKSFIKHCNKTTCTDVTVFGNVHNEIIKHGMELLGIVSNLNKSAICELDRRIFSPYRSVNAPWTVLLYERILSAQSINEFFGLLREVHIVSHIAVVGGFFYLIVVPHNVDLHNIVLFFKLCKCYGGVAFIFILNTLHDFKKSGIGLSLYGCFYIIYGCGKYLLGFYLHHSVLKNVGKGACNQIRNNNTSQKPTLEGVCNFVASLFCRKTITA